MYAALRLASSDCVISSTQLHRQTCKAVPCSTVRIAYLHHKGDANTVMNLSPPCQREGRVVTQHMLWSPPMQCCPFALLLLHIYAAHKCLITHCLPHVTGHCCSCFYYNSVRLVHCDTPAWHFSTCSVRV